MIKVTILYPNKDGGRFDFDYYLNRHMPLSNERLGIALKQVIIERGLAGTTPNSPPAYIAICHLFFESVEAFLQAFMPHAAELQGDIVHYTDVEPVIQFSEVAMQVNFSTSAR